MLKFKGYIAFTTVEFESLSADLAQRRLDKLAKEIQDRRSYYDLDLDLNMEVAEVIELTHAE